SLDENWQTHYVAMGAISFTWRCGHRLRRPQTDLRTTAFLPLRGSRHAAWTSAPAASSVFMTGLCHPPAGTILPSTCAGPHVPCSYSYTGVFPLSTGSTIRHASST